MTTENQAVQIVIFKLKPAASRDRLIELTAQMKRWLLTQEGFIAYEIYEDSRSWADRIVWRDPESAARINAAFLGSEIYKEIMTLIEPDYCGFLGRPVAV